MTGRYQRITLALLLISTVSLLFAALSASQDIEEIVKKTEAYLAEQAARGRFSGTVLFAKDGVPVFKQAFGLANRSFEVPNRIDTKFNLGSMNKMFTGVSIAQLAEKGKLSFDDTIGDHVPDYSNSEVAGKVQIHHLLTHTSGLGHYWTDEYMKTSKDRFRDVEDYLPLFVDQPLLFEPGSEFSYSNAGYMVLGLIVERVSGQSYFDYVMESVYRPAGMINTDAYELDYVVPNLAVGYTRAGAREGGLKNNLFTHVVKGGPAGGGYSTVEDLLAFSNALLDNRLLSPEHTELVFDGKVTRVDNIKYAYGFSNRIENGHKIIGHSGGFQGINSVLSMYVDLGYTIAVMSNADRGAMDVRDFIEEQLIGKSLRTKNREFTHMILAHIEQNGYDAGVELYGKNPDNLTVLENMVNQRGYELMGREKFSGAVDVLRFNVFLYPESANCYDSLGEAYMTAGNTELAIWFYEKSVQLAPGNTNGIEMLKRLRAGKEQ